MTFLRVKLVAPMENGEALFSSVSKSIFANFQSLPLERDSSAKI